MQILALYNIKGGVGKTASAVNLAYLAAAGGSRVLLWDLDPQGAAGHCLRLPSKIKGGRKALLDKKSSTAAFIRPTEYPNLDLLPADFSYRNLDQSLLDQKKPERAFSRLLEPLVAAYDYLFIDCPPGINLTTEAVFHAADVVLVPLTPTALSTRTYEQINAFLAREKIKRLTVLAFFTMAGPRRKLHREIMEAMRAAAPGLLQTVIPNASAVERMATEQKPLPVYSPRSATAAAYAALWDEVRGRPATAA